MVMKIDLVKAYDNLSWHFLRETPHEFNFNEKWIDLIMCCVTTV